jgi:hypothetical protein
MRTHGRSRCRERNRGEPFKQWVVVPPEQADEWEPLAIEAVAGAGTRAGAGEQAAEST